jgi:hypothetical protein
MRVVGRFACLIALAALPWLGAATASAHISKPARPARARHGVLRPPRSAHVHLARGRIVLGRRRTASQPRQSPGSEYAITQCGVELTAPGTYTVEKNLDSATSGADGYCIWIASSDVRVNLNGHTITNSASDFYGIVIESQSAEADVMGDGVWGGAIDGYDNAVGEYASSATTLENLDITVAGASQCIECAGRERGARARRGPRLSRLARARLLDDQVPLTNAGIAGDYAVATWASNIDVTLADSSATAFYFQDGSENRVTDSTTTYTGYFPRAYQVLDEYDDTFENDTVECLTLTGQLTSGCGGTGFFELDSNRDKYVNDGSLGSYNGFFLEEDALGTVTATDDYASDTPGDGSGFYLYENYDGEAFGGPLVSTYTDDATTGFSYGFEDYYSPGSIYTYDTVRFPSQYGFYLDAPAGYSITHDTVLGANTAGEMQSSSAYGFYVLANLAADAPSAFDYNMANGLEYGYASQYPLSGTDNTYANDRYGWVVGVGGGG